MKALIVSSHLPVENLLEALIGLFMPRPSGSRGSRRRNAQPVPHTAEEIRQARSLAAMKLRESLQILRSELPLFESDADARLTALLGLGFPIRVEDVSELAERLKVFFGLAFRDRNDDTTDGVLPRPDDRRLVVRSRGALLASGPSQRALNQLLAAGCGSIHDIHPLETREQVIAALSVTPDLLWVGDTGWFMFHDRPCWLVVAAAKCLCAMPQVDAQVMTEQICRMAPTASSLPPTAVALAAARQTGAIITEDGLISHPTPPDPLACLEPVERILVDYLWNNDAIASYEQLCCALVAHRINRAALRRLLTSSPAIAPTGWKFYTLPGLRPKEPSFFVKDDKASLRWLDDNVAEISRTLSGSAIINGTLPLVQDFHRFAPGIYRGLHGEKPISVSVRSKCMTGMANLFAAADCAPGDVVTLTLDVDKLEICNLKVVRAEFKKCLLAA